MRVSRIIHQQIWQLKWHLLACFALIMVLPFEEAMVNLTTGDGFFSAAGVVFSVLFTPLLAGLIACANVQADLNEKRYIFWRSKPAGVKLLIAVKFVVGLIAALAVLACPVVFALVTGATSGRPLADELNDPDVTSSALTFLLMVIMAYSLCFASNIIVRKTARSWLIGMFLACFILITPFILPLDVKDLVTDVVFGMPGLYPAITLAASAVALAFALFAAQHDWHLKTSLKGMLWAAAALIFAVMILLTSQVANIKVLDARHVGYSWNNLDLNRIGNRIAHQSRNYVNIENNRIYFSEIEGADPNTTEPLKTLSRPELKAYHERQYPDFRDRIFHKTDDGIFNYTIRAYYLTKFTKRFPKKPLKTRDYKKVILITSQLIGDYFYPVSELDISDCLGDIKDRTWIALRRIDNMIVVRVNNSCVVLDATNPARLNRIETKLDILKRTQFYFGEDPREFTIPLVPLESIALPDRVKFSIDLRYSYLGMYNASRVDIHNGKIGFVSVSDQNIARYDVTHWDDEKIYCARAETRPFTILEHLTGANSGWLRERVRNGRLYLHGDENLMVFDIRPGRRIKKLGHFVRMEHEFQDIAPLDDGRILFSAVNRRERNEDRGPKTYLYLLENPG